MKRHCLQRGTKKYAEVTFSGFFKGGKKLRNANTITASGPAGSKTQAEKAGLVPAFSVLLGPASWQSCYSEKEVKHPKTGNQHQMQQPDEEWFSTWFDSPYYHILYQHRNHDEARFFLDNLLTHLHPKPDARILDLACGKGRHSVYLNSKGYDVTGVDLSEQSIAYAKQFENDRLHFEVHDMRNPYKDCCFDFILNLFTSFGYFETETENVVALHEAAESLKHGGKLVIDFLNTPITINNLVASETKTVEGITFNIHRGVENGFIVKTITFEDKGQNFRYQERVRALTEADFMEYFRMVNLRVAEVFGDYGLNPFDPDKSERMIFILKK